MNINIYIKNSIFFYIIMLKEESHEDLIPKKDYFNFLDTILKEESIKYNTLDNLFDLSFNLRDKSNVINEELELPKDKILYEIVFFDGSIEKFDSTKGIFLIENNEQIKTTIGEIYEGAKIRFY